VTALDPRADLSAAPARHGRGPWFVVGQYVALTKPRIIELLLITTVPVMFLAARGVPSLWLVLATYKDVVLAALFAAFAVTVLLFSTAFLARE